MGYRTDMVGVAAHIPSAIFEQLTVRRSCEWVMRPAGWMG